MKIRPPHSGALLLILIGIVVSLYFLEQADATLANPAVGGFQRARRAVGAAHRWR